MAENDLVKWLVTTDQQPMAAVPSGVLIFNEVNNGAIVFRIGGIDVLRFENDGRVLARGELVETNKDLVDAFKEWFVKIREVKT